MTLSTDLALAQFDKAERDSGSSADLDTESAHSRTGDMASTGLAIGHDSRRGPWLCQPQ